jgi:hypothetical protein
MIHEQMRRTGSQQSKYCDAFASETNMNFQKGATDMERYFQRALWGMATRPKGRMDSAFDFTLAFSTVRDTPAQLRV